MSDQSQDQARLLIVEDHFETRTYLRLALEGSHHVTVVSTAEEALLALEHGSCDLLLVDIALGKGMNGIELVASLRRSADYADVPIIGMTAHQFGNGRKEMLQEGFDAFLPKPFFPEDLLRLVTKLLSDGRPPKEQPRPSS